MLVQAFVVAASTAAPEVPDVSKVDIRVGKIISCEQHPDADRWWTAAESPMSCLIPEIRSGIMFTDLSFDLCAAYQGSLFLKNLRG